MGRAWMLVSNHSDKKTGRFVRAYFLANHGIILKFKGLEIPIVKNPLGFNVTTRVSHSDSYKKFIVRASDKMVKDNSFIEVHIVQNGQKEIGLLVVKTDDVWSLRMLYKAEKGKVEEGSLIDYFRNKGFMEITPEKIMGDLLINNKLTFVELDEFLKRFSSFISYLNSKGGRYERETV